ncbi:MAG: stage II sporulation protein P [Bacilli bacterium]
MKKIRLKKKYKKIKLLIYPFLLFLLYQVISYIFLDIKLVNSNEEFIKKLLQNSNYHLLYEKQHNNIVYKFINFIDNIKVDKPITILESAFAYEKEEATSTFAYINNLVVDDPRVYIYNTHPTEGYEGVLEGYNIKPGVIMASYLLQDRLNASGIKTIVEERSAAAYIKEHNIDYSDSYTATRVFMKDFLKQHNNMDLIIDLHRDALSKENSTVTINNKKYAKVLFVQNKKFENINLAKKLNKTINEKYPGLSRGIYDKYNDVFNQDLNSNVILLEVGGNKNDIGEVINTIDAIADIIKENLK